MYLMKCGKNIFGGRYYSHIGGKSYYFEGVVNYISTSLSGKKEDEIKTHRYETKAMEMLAEKVGVEKFIRAVWDSDEKMLQNAYIESEMSQKKYQDKTI